MLRRTLGRLRKAPLRGPGKTTEERDNDIRRLRTSFEQQRLQILSTAAGVNRSETNIRSNKEVVTDFDKLKFAWTDRQKKRLQEGTETVTDTIDVIGKAVFKYHFGDDGNIASQVKVVYDGSKTTASRRDHRWQASFSVKSKHINGGPIVLAAQSPHHLIFWLWDKTLGITHHTMSNATVNVHIKGADHPTEGLQLNNKIGQVLGCFLNER
eukprot:TRINITY_DN13178_c0_g1_i1.p1 TRINITY_DN13178_c0_g1~~TRINITY_DN13178_c0_g1_i1.p1  ORF type:complete len:211 (+),score=26.07 TRINITY_DN13178_c0_g1_i1:145-777(+)